jgi:hypothetical protein
MSCVLRIGGKNLDPDALVRILGMPIYRIDRKGEPRVLRSRGMYEAGAIHLDVSNAAFADLQAQVADAIAFLAANAGPLGAATRFPGVDYATLDFAVERTDVTIDSKQLPPDLLRRAGELEIGIELSIYPHGGGDAA